MPDQQNIKYGGTSANTKSSVVHIPCISSRFTLFVGLRAVYCALFFLLVSSILLCFLFYSLQSCE